ncbi:MAG TPA: MBL fold metallo-hydrolase [Burkholderiales bacterium]|nr:MBL fold metallo-hydrolase [Burkholderiales bacterium]
MPPKNEGDAAALASGNPVGYLIQVNNGPVIYHTGDTDVHNDTRLISQFYKVDVMFAAIGGHFTMDPVRAALDERGLGARMVEMKPGETRGF